MKKLGTIICIALMLTVGGVYATFNYAQTTAGSVEETVGHTIEGAVTNTAKGTIGLVSNYAIEVVNAGNNKTDTVLQEPPRLRSRLRQAPTRT